MKQYSGALKSFRSYWTSYGGWRAILGSPYLFVAIVLTGAMAPIWLRSAWWDIVLSVMPNVLGFSLGGFAIFLAFGDEGFRNLIAGSDPDDEAGASPYIGFASAFLHFIVVQVFAVILALLSKAWFLVEVSPKSRFFLMNEWVRPVWWFLGFGVFCYALCSALAAGIAIFSLTRSFDFYITNSKGHTKGDDSGEAD